MGWKRAFLSSCGTVSSKLQPGNSELFFETANPKLTREIDEQLLSRMSRRGSESEASSELMESVVITPSHLMNGDDGPGIPASTNQSNRELTIFDIVPAIRLTPSKEASPLHPIRLSDDNQESRSSRCVSSQG
jgi:hypothetical protein